jgi:hypothetical protein
VWLEAVTVKPNLLTVNVAPVEFAVCVPLQVLVKTARYWLPLRETVGLLTVRVVVVTPLYGAVSVSGVHDPPPFVLTCH